MGSWTKERPKRPGHYWMHFEGHMPEMVKLTVDDEDNALLVYYFGCDYPEFLSEGKFSAAEWQEVSDFSDNDSDRIAQLEKAIEELRNRPPAIFVHGGNWGPGQVQAPWKIEPHWQRQQTTAPDPQPQYRDYWGNWLPPGVVPTGKVTAGTTLAERMPATSQFGNKTTIA